MLPYKNSSPLALIFSLHTQSEKEFFNDEQKIREALLNRRFEVRSFKNLNCAEFLKKLETVSKENHSGRDSFWLFVISHQTQGMIYIKDKSISVGQLFEPFSETRCPTLAGKPKIFILQSCEAIQTSGNITLTYSHELDMDDHTYTFPILNQRDILVLRSPFSDGTSSKKSHFLKALCAELNLAESLKIPDVFQTTMSSLVDSSFKCAGNRSIGNPPVMYSSLTKKFLLNDIYNSNKLGSSHYLITFLAIFTLIYFGTS